MSLQNLMQDVESEISNFDLTSLADGSVSQTQVVQAVFDKLRRRGQLPNYWRYYFYYYYSAKKLKLRRALQILCGAFERCSRVRL